MNGPQSMRVQIDGYEDAAEIGRGGFGVVYRAFQPKFHRTVAIKVMSGTSVDSKMRDRFDRERLAMGSLSAHPNIMTVYDAGFTEHGHPFIVMEYTPKGSLADLLASRGPLTPGEMVGVGVKMADALEAAHEGGILHRDVKPENIMVTPYGEPMLSDFGIARLRTGPMTTTGMVTATLDHAPPEILDGQKPSPESDVYSLASSLYALLTGVSPFRKDTDETITPIIARIITAPVPPLPEETLPAPLFRVLERAMAKDAADRYHSAAAFKAALQEAATLAGVTLAAVALDAESVPVVPPVKRPSEPTVIRDTGDPPSPSGPGEVATPGGEATRRAPDPDSTIPDPGSASEPVVVAEGKPTLQDRVRQPAVLALAGFLLIALLGTGAFALVSGRGEGEEQAAPMRVDDTEETTTTTTAAEAEVTNYEVAGGATLEISAERGMISEIVLEPRHGVAVLAGGRLSYTADIDYSGNDSLVYEACEDDRCTLHEASIQVAGSNPAPELNDDAATAQVPDAVTIDVLVNDTDDDGIDASSVIVITQPRGGTATVNGDGSITYVPAGDFSGTDKFQYEACDRAETPACGFATVTVSVTAAATTTTSTTRAPTVTTQAPTTTTLAAPNAVGDTLTVNEDTPGTANVLSNDTGSKDTGTLKVLTSPSHGSATVSSGSISYSPSSNYNGSDSFTYEICNSGGCGSATVTVTVVAVNDAPTAGSTSDTVELGGAVCIDLLARGVIGDVDGDSLTVTAVGTSSLGASITIGGDLPLCNGPTEVHYFFVPFEGTTGTDTFSYTVSDGSATASSSITITVTPPPNSPPTLECSASQSVNLSGVTNFWFGVPKSCFSDPDGDSLDIFSTQPAIGSVSGTNVNPDCDTATLYCWRYIEPADWDGTSYQTIVQIYAVDPSGEQSAFLTLTLCVGC